jgi:hypothetical protein
MQRVALLIVSVIAVSAVSCTPAAKQPDTNVTASDFDLNPLVGVWRGSYTNPTAGRTGTIAFTLRAGESNATGNVVMIPKPDSLLTAEERELLSESPPQSRAVLPIHFIRKQGGNVTGTLDPYRSPDCDCIMATTFQGTFTDATTIEGTFTNVPSRAGSSITTGTWKVTRVKKL